MHSIPLDMQSFAFAMIRNIFSEYMKINNACQCVMMTTVIMASVVVDTRPIIESICMCLPQSKIQTILVYTPTAYIYVYTYLLPRNAELAGCYGSAVVPARSLKITMLSVRSARHTMVGERCALQQRIVLGHACYESTMTYAN